MDIVLLYFLSLFLISCTDGQQQRPWTSRDCQEMSRACQPLPKGSQGSPGEIGSPGGRGRPGNPGRRGPAGPRGFTGSSRPGPPGPKTQRGEIGDPGIPGPFGEPGQIGPKGVKGQKAVGGFSGTKGQKGDRGQTGLTGGRGITGDSASAWTRCTWRIDSRQDNGLIKECVFSKKDQLSSLHVVYEGTLQVGLCARCCKRWYFTFNNVECARPTVIDAVMSGGMRNDFPHLTYGRIEGLCENNLQPGQVRVALQIKNCPGIPGASQPVIIDLYNPIGNILIREVTPSQ